jgi:hypothetical protein
MLDVDTVKEYIKDKPELNILYDNIEQFSDDLMDVVIPMTYSEASILAPAIAKDPTRVPDVIILHGVISRLLESESFLELRNQVQYQDNNMSSMPLSAKQAQYSQLSQMMRQYFQQLLTAYATAHFYNTAWGGVTSNSIDYDTMYAGYFGTALYENLWI